MTEEHTHRVVGGNHRRGSGDGSPATILEPGTPVTPTEAELDAFPFRFERIRPDPDEDDAEDTAENAENAAQSDASTDEADGSDDDTEATSGDEADETADAGDDHDLTTDEVEAADYTRLRNLAKRYDDVNGNWGEDRLRAELKAKATGD